MTFSEYREHSEPLFKQLRILRIQDSIFLQNCLFVHDFFHDNLPKSFNNIFSKADHKYKTRNSDLGMLAIPQYNSTIYGQKCIYKQCIDNWNLLSQSLRASRGDKEFPINLYSLSRGQIKTKIKKILFDTYN